MQNKLILNDGTEIIDGFASKSSANRLMIRIPGNDLASAAIEFSNKEKTRVITCYYSISKTTYTGFTDMYSVQYFADENYVEIWLNSEDGSVKKELTVPAEYVPAEVNNYDMEEESQDGSEESDSN